MTNGLTYAVGDIHGCAGLLERLLARIEDHAAGEPHALVFLGDYIDRGPDSAGVIRLLRTLQWRDPERVTCLMGNHEALLLAALREPGGMDRWCMSGGEETLRSFGVHEAAAIPGEVLDWVEALPTVHSDARRWYVHAGFRPGQEAPDPDIHTRLWIREPFLSEDHDFGRHVVHGHTPQKRGRPDIRAHRTNLDTAAVYGGALTAGVFDGSRGPARDFLSVRAD
ncbi:metallophosphoesterase family protein [Methylobacterium sp. sgz302541]|uniref:metallophosphoesterase family protein n=1 Tax=unclassified Methylobacterium TaxID=2615210 RepID=UPI003D340139